MFEHIVRRGVLLSVAVLIVSVLGILAATRIPVQMIPDLDLRTISIRTTWPGATPQDIEKEILIEQEETLRNLANLSRLVATASSGRAEIELEFPFGIDVNETLIRVNNALSQVPSYPENVDEPTIYANSFSSNSFMFFSVAPLPGNPRSLDMDLVRDFLIDQVRPRLSTVPGVSEISLWGGADRQIQIFVDPAALAQRGLGLGDVRAAIRERNRDRSAGQVDAGKRRYLLRTVGRFDELDELNDVVLARRGDALVRLGDVAEVRLDHFELSTQASVNGMPTISLGVRKEAGSNVIAIKEAMVAEVERVNRELMRPAGLLIRPIADDVVYVQESVANVWLNLVLGALLATAVMFLFLRSLRATAVGVIGIPLCTIAAFLGLLLFGRTINVISLAGVAFAIGMTLDNSIVVLESIEFERRRGRSRLQAAIEGVRQVWPAVLASTLTTVLVFLPVAFVEQEAGQLYSDIAIAISASILASMLVAITVVPTAAANLGFGSSGPQSVADSRWRERSLAAVDGLIATARRRFTVLAVTIVGAVAIALLLTPPAEYLPEGEEPKIFAHMNAPPGYNLRTMDEIASELKTYFLPAVEANPVAYDRGDTEVPPVRYLNVWVFPERIMIITEPVRHADIDALMDAITARYERYPGMRAFAARGSIISSNDGGTRSINLDVSGPRLEPIYDVALAAYQRAGEVFDNPRIQSSPSSLSLAQPLVEVRPNWERAAELGISNEALGYTVAALTDGAYVDEFFLDDDKIDIYLYSEAGVEAELGSLADMPVYTPAGAVLPLSSLARIEETVDTSTVRRVNGQRTVTLNIIPPREVALETGVGRVREEVVQYLRDRGEIPAGVSLDISGAADQLQATREALGSNYLVALIIVYLLMVAIFTHWGYPLLVMTTIPLGLAGGLVGLALLNAFGALTGTFHQPFDMITMLGFLILMGTVVNNPILIVHRAMHNAGEGGMNPREAVREAVSARLRPIAMSTITTVCGLAPLVLIPGAGTELYRGVGSIVMFGIVGSAVVTLTMLPALTVTVLGWRKSGPSGGEASPQE